MERSDSAVSKASRASKDKGKDGVADTQGSGDGGIFDMPSVNVAGDAHPKVLRALKLMRDIHWDTSGAVVGSATEYTPINIRNIDDIKRDARSNLLKTAKVGRNYHIGQINTTSHFLRPNSANANLVSQVCAEEDQRLRYRRKLLRRAKGQSKSMDKSPLERSSSLPPPISTQQSLAMESSRAFMDAESFEQGGDIFEDCGRADASPVDGPRPLSGTHRSQSWKKSPSGGERSMGEQAADTQRAGVRPLSGRNISGRPTSGQRSAGKASPGGTQGGLRHQHSLQEGKHTPKALPAVRAKTFEVRPKQNKEEKEKSAIAKIEEKKNRVLQKQLDIQRKDQQLMWLKVIAYVSRTGLLLNTLLRSRNLDASVKRFCFSQGIILKILKWWRPVRINLWKRKNPKLVKVLSTFFLKTRLKLYLNRIRESVAMMGKFLRDASNAGERYKRMRLFRCSIIRLQKYTKEYFDIQRSRMQLLKMALDRMVLEKLNRLKKEKAAHELNAVNKLKYKRDFGPTVVKIQKITLYTNQLLNASAASTGHSTRRRRQPQVVAESPENSAGVDVLQSVGLGSVTSNWYPGNSFSGFGVDAGGRPPNPEYTSKMILSDLWGVLTNQRRRHCLAAAEYEASVTAMKGVTDVGISRVKSFLKDANDIGPMIEETASYKVKRQYFLLLTLGGLSELEEIATHVVQEYVNAESDKIKIAI